MLSLKSCWMGRLFEEDGMFDDGSFKLRLIIVGILTGLFCAEIAMLVYIAINV